MASKDLLITDREAVQKKWGKNKETVQKDIEIVKNWLKTQKHLPEMPNDNIIEFILTNCKFSIEKTKKNVDMYYSIRSLMPHLFEESHPQFPTNQAIYQFPLPKLTDDLHRINIIKYKEDKEDVFDPHKMIVYGFKLSEIRMHEDLVMGEIYLIDCQHFKMSHATKFTATVLKKMMFNSENIWSYRLKAVHVINHSSYVDILMSITKTILKKKLYERIFFHPNLESVHNVIPKELLPRDYGGSGKSLDEMEVLWDLKFEEYSSRFVELDKLRVQEDLRPTPLVNDEVLGYHGNFKKLDVD